MKSKIFPKGFPLFIRRFNKISSTNDYALEYLVKEGARSNGAVFISQYQEKGRGRLGRNWFSKPGQNLLMSFIFVPPENYRWNLIPLAIGLSCSKAIEKYRNVLTQIKWPNDIIFNKRKMGGILTESRTIGNNPLGVVVGIGMNIKGGKSDYPEELSDLVTTLEEASNSECNVEEFSNYLFKEIPDSLNSLFLEVGDLLKELEKVMAHKKNDEIEISLGGEILHGKYLGLSENGEIIVSSKNGLNVFNCGEIVKIRD